MKKKLDFEASLLRLEELLTEMEKKDLPLNKLLDSFKEGVELLQNCRHQLDEAQNILEEFNPEV